jgi:glucose/mannose-6-phosphate isomerase
MNMDQFEKIHEIDRENMYAFIHELPDQLEVAWRLGQTQELPQMEAIDRVLIAGMGGSAIGADLVCAYVSHQCPVPVIVHREYWLPQWARNERTLVIASSHSGNTEETISVYEQAKTSGIKRMAICTGGILADLAANDGVPVWHFEHKGQPRAAVGFSFGLLLALFHRLGLITFKEQDLLDTIREMKQQQALCALEQPTEINPAKGLASRLVNKWIVVIGADYLAPVARRWKGQLNELAKAWAQHELLPEADHNTLAGTQNPDELLRQMKIVTLISSTDHPRNQLRTKLTEKALHSEELDVEVINIGAHDPLTNIWLGLQLGDYTAFYLAMLYHVDPTPIVIMSKLKREMKNYPG